MARNKIVLDTNVLISALLGNHLSPPWQLIYKCILTERRALPCVSEAVWDEYQRVIRYQKFERFDGFLPRAETVLRRLHPVMEHFQPTQRLSVIGDEPDNRFLELAVEANAHFLITGNTRDFTFSEFQGVRIVSPKEFVETHCI